MRWFQQEEAPAQPQTYLEKASALLLTQYLLIFEQFYASRDSNEVLRGA